MALSSIEGTPEPDIREEVECFAACLREASSPREGLWSIFVTLAWIAARDEHFVAASQLFEQRRHADRGSLFSLSVWHCLNNAASKRRGSISLVEAEQRLRVALEAGELEGGQAKRIGSDESDFVSTPRWADWKPEHLLSGVSLIPGLYDFRWLSPAVRNAFQAEQVPAQDKWSAFSGNGSPTPQQVGAFRFFDMKEGLSPDGWLHETATKLKGDYLEAIGKGRIRGTALKRTAFEDMLSRYREGWRIEGRRWKMSDHMSE